MHYLLCIMHYLLFIMYYALSVFFSTFQEFYQPVKKTVITKTPNKVPPKKPDENIISPQKKIENETTNSNEKDANKKEVTPNTTDKTKVNSDKKNKDNNATSQQPGIFSWLWRYFPKKKT
ncbi:hypothetical protein YYC_03837 [Plasmodium yoelii 17X]|uniref:Uncharacterized protein n=1 Tax=Plasmodium yoelii 17X TaxID=1323249 RepID=V7PGM0_PLAYE|nr:hypothetical protein YYC_03837 [Plasmodium yoelii 17X]